VISAVSPIMNRRMDLRALLLFSLPFLLFPAGVGAEPASRIPVEVLFGNPKLSQPKLSPDGKQIAFVSSKGDTQTVFVRSVVGSKPVGLAEFPLDQVGLRWFDWATSERLVLSADARDPKASGLLAPETRLYAVSDRRPRLKWLGEKWQAHDPDQSISKARFPDRVIGLMPRDRENVLISHLEVDEPSPGVSTMNLRTGRLRTVQKGDRDFNGAFQFHRSVAE
jgi:hypothetical protein